MTCKHENADHLNPGEWFTPSSDAPPRIDAVIAIVEQFRCVDCGAWLSLGPARDTGYTRVEIAAARLIAGYEDGNDTDDTLDDPICRDVIEQMTGMRNIRSKLGREAFQIHEAARRTP